MKTNCIQFLFAPIFAILLITASANTVIANTKTDASKKDIQSCSIDLHNQSQVIERLAELKSKILNSSQSKTDLAIYISSIYDPQIKQFAEKFGVDEKEFSQLIENKYQELKNQRTKTETIDESRKIIQEGVETIKNEIEKIKLGRPMQFHTIEPGSFLMGEEKVKTIILKPFDMMDTLVTQKQWTLIMGENPSRFSEGPDAEEVLIDGRMRKILPDNPVERVSYHDVQVFIKKINDRSMQGDQLLVNLIPGHTKGAIYRLPTEAEWEYVITNRGQVTTKYYYGDDEARLGDYAWYSENANGTTHPVAQKLPIIVIGKSGQELKFYDLYGNVGEWTQDLWDESLSGGRDPKGGKTGARHVVRSASWINFARHMHSKIRHNIDDSTRNDFIGLRLVREH